MGRKTRKWTTLGDIHEPHFQDGTRSPPRQRRARLEQLALLRTHGGTPSILAVPLREAETGSMLSSWCKTAELNGGIVPCPFEQGRDCIQGLSVYAPMHCRSSPLRCGPAARKPRPSEPASFGEGPRVVSLEGAHFAGPNQESPKTGTHDPSRVRSAWPRATRASRRPDAPSLIAEVHPGEYSFADGVPGDCVVPPPPRLVASISATCHVPAPVLLGGKELGLMLPPPVQTPEGLRGQPRRSLGKSGADMDRSLGAPLVSRHVPRRWTTP